MKPNKVFIGQIAEDSLNKVSIEYNSGDRIYMFSDGIIDQYDESDQRKFGHRRLKELIRQTRDLDICYQGEVISLVLDQWRGSNRQLDDMILIGIELKK